MRRLEREVKGLKLLYDSLKIKTLCMSDEDKKDPQFKQDAGKLDGLRKQIAVKERTIIEIKLALQDPLKWFKKLLILKGLQVFLNKINIFQTTFCYQISFKYS